MAQPHKTDTTSLPENAYGELAPGETYRPVMPDTPAPREVTPYSVTFGILMAVVFSAAAAYLGLRVGQVFEAAIPIAIIAVGVGNLTGRRNMLGQNVIIQSIGASSGVVVAGAIFTLPALYILGLEAQFYQIFLSSLFGGMLGILLLIPFRKYFVRDMHGKLPFPEATATTEVLVSGEKKGNQAKLLAVSGLVGGVYDFIISTFGWWTEEISTRMTDWGEALADKMKVVLKINTGAAVLGLGYIVGLRYAAYICAGSFTVWFVLIPFLSHFADGQTLAVGEGITTLLRDMTPEMIFKNYARHIGIGGIAMAGVIGIVRSSNIIRQALGLAVTELRGRRAGAETDPLGADRRTGHDVHLFPLRTAGQLAPRGHRDRHCFCHLVPVHDRRGQRHRNRRHEPGIGHDADDTNPQLADTGQRRTQRHGRHDRRTDHRRRGLHGARHGRRFHLRPENRLLARLDAR